MTNPIFYIESETDLIVGGPCDGMRTATPFDSQHAVVMLQPPPAPSEELTPYQTYMGNVIANDGRFEVQASVPYDIATLCVPDGTGKTKFVRGRIVVDRVIRIWYRKFQDLSETEAISLLFKNYKKQEETNAAF